MSNRTVTISGKIYTYQCPWDGHTRFSSSFDAPLAFDTETALIDEKKAYDVPVLVLGSVSDGKRHALLHPAQLASFILAHSGAHFVGQHVAFDFWVVERCLRESGRAPALAALWNIADQGRLHDAMYLDMLVRLGNGDYGDGLRRRSLGDIAKQWAKLDVNKADPYRLRYGELIGKDWPKVTETGFWDYAILDAIATHAAFKAMAPVAKSLLHAAKKRFPKDFIPGAEQALGYLTESLQVRAAIALQASGRLGVLADQSKVKVFETKLRAEMDGHVSTMRKSFPQVLVYRDECSPIGALKKAKVVDPKQGKLFDYAIPPDERVVMLTKKSRTPRLKQTELRACLEGIAEERGWKAPRSTGKKPGTSLSAKAWKHLAKKHDFLGAWCKVVTLSKNLSFFDLFREDCYVHPHYEVLMRTGRTSSYKPNMQNCFSADTEILTEAGWARLDDTADTKVAQFDPETSEITFVEPEWVEQKWSRPLLSISNDHIDLCLTPDHNCLLRHRKDGTYHDVKADDYPEDYEQLHAGMFEGGSSLDLSPEQLCYLLAFQADGTWADGGGMDFSLKLPRKLKRLKALLGSLNAKYTLKPRKAEGTWRFLVPPGQPLSKLTAALLGPDKLFGPWLLSLSRGLLDLFCEEIWFWDATEGRKTAYACEHKSNADWAQIVLTLSGRRAQVRRYETGGKPSWQVDHTEDSDASSTTGVAITEVECEGGKVYCATVPSGYIVVRRNGKVQVTGNCPRGPDFRELFVPRVGHVLMTSDYSAIELRTLAAICERRFGFSVLGDTIRAGRDPHEYTAAKLRDMEFEDFRSLQVTNPKLYEADRQAAKPVNFGVPGGLGADKLAGYARDTYGVEMSVEQAAAFRNKLITEIYPELGLYLEDNGVENLAYTLGLSTRHVLGALGLGPNDEANSGAIMRATSKALRGDPFKKDGTPYKQHFIDRVWNGMRSLTAASSKCGKTVREKVVAREPSLWLERELFCGLAVTPTGRLRGGCTYTQARNAPFQGLAADGAKLALWELTKRGFRVVAFIHDEVVIELPVADVKAKQAEAEEALVKCMERSWGGAQRLPAAVKSHVGPCWKKA